MADCEVLDRCPFFKGTMKELVAASDVMKSRYCLSDNLHCARHMVLVALGATRVPADLFPHQADRARALIAAASGSSG